MNDIHTCMWVCMCVCVLVCICAYACMRVCTMYVSIRWLHVTWSWAAVVAVVVGVVCRFSSCPSPAERRQSSFNQRLDCISNDSIYSLYGPATLPVTATTSMESSRITAPSGSSVPFVVPPSFFLHSFRDLCCQPHPRGRPALSVIFQSGKRSFRARTRLTPTMNSTECVVSSGNKDFFRTVIDPEAQLGLMICIRSYMVHTCDLWNKIESSFIQVEAIMLHIKLARDAIAVYIMI